MDLTNFFWLTGLVVALAYSIVVLKFIFIFRFIGRWVELDQEHLRVFESEADRGSVVYDVKCSQIDLVEGSPWDPLVVVIKLTGGSVIRCKLGVKERAEDFVQYLSKNFQVFFSFFFFPSSFHHFFFHH